MRLMLSLRKVAENENKQWERSYLFHACFGDPRPFIVFHSRHLTLLSSLLYVFETTYSIGVSGSWVACYSIATRHVRQLVPHEKPRLQRQRRPLQLAPFLSDQLRIQKLTQFQQLDSRER